ncbi:hypothetical protein K437DRAFT_254236 [Tilletiaria anomala UBC 951]|uniref:Uncharacterized protein n=1 Tax=Tilletiaria anomala (strain ATCC 24038 / CBS 436.72 / UBC 951) TaxID=1037660 RepID=A0A066WEU0_TILAU|nr:uncharacterized protein K437DRAFT_254236 [Tilletiaria anomala UBC 951]KDN52457.1 hypothetical protein K437DRAFT_254236 [Tilletiaria anomala UBC 951]
MFVHTIEGPCLSCFVLLVARSSVDRHISTGYSVQVCFSAGASTLQTRRTCQAQAGSHESDRRKPFAFPIEQLQPVISRTCLSTCGNLCQLASQGQWVVG